MPRHRGGVLAAVGPSTIGEHQDDCFARGTPGLVPSDVARGPQARRILRGDPAGLSLPFLRGESPVPPTKALPVITQEEDDVS